MLTDLRRRMDDYREDFNKEIENTRKYQVEVTKLKNTVVELKIHTTEFQQQTR